MPTEAVAQRSLRLSGRAICLAVSTKYFTGAFDYFTFRANYATYGKHHTGGTANEEKRDHARDRRAALGVSTVTISKALSGKDGVSDAVREKIIKTAQQMGYH